MFVVSDFTVVLSVGDTSVLEGGNLTIGGTTEGGPRIVSYVWRRNGVVISGENGSHLTLTDMSTDDIGEYELTITSAENISFSAVVNIGLTCKNILKINNLSYNCSKSNKNRWIRTSDHH